ncbi:membrane protein, PF09858 family [Leptospira broomii serovar Hurstbridge str. 5399]|uniref:Membrane protein, PF09858 family n=1 Tax=Leptospira broomii serovar Hurstbridge str. 5399 TaxID=1049789 RepID=T0FDD8_9LEPT|nr:DUF2085 domain-containing protein [Leptospira broomii]EQA45587.1 membrane protein, PF09858 family [Leptospira broomii serovar Hurstbridge str. 5399]
MKSSVTWHRIEGVLLRKMDSIRENVSHIPFFCHQWEERSFAYKGHVFPVCARCTGVYFGQISSLFFLPWNWSFSITLIIPFSLMIPMLADWSLQEYLNMTSNNVRRVITGYLGGVGFYGIGIFAVHNIFLWLRHLLFN